MRVTYLFVCLFVLLSGPARAALDPAAALQTRYRLLETKLSRNSFGRPLVITSGDQDGRSSGDAYGVLDYPFAQVATALDSGTDWCNVLDLHLNVKYCRANGGTLTVYAGRKFYQPLDDAHRLDYRYAVAAKRADYLRIELTAAKGPFGTSNYRIVFEAVPLKDGRSFVHLGYAYSYGFWARTAMSAYLATLGRGKEGFTVTGYDRHGAPEYIGGLRGAVERNAMRYYLAVEADLAARKLPPAERRLARERDWFAMSESYARQLHEISEADYLVMKRREAAREVRGHE